MASSLHTPEHARFVAALVAARRKQGLRQGEVAARLGKPQSVVAKIEGGERRVDVVEFIALARALDLDPLSFFAEILGSIESAE